MIRHPYWFLAFVTLLCVLFRAGCAEPAEAATLTASGQQWVIEFQPHVDNVGVVVVTECKTPGFFAYDAFPILDAGDSRLRARRQPTPKGARCTVQADIMRARDEDPTHDYIGESVIVIQQEDGRLETVQPPAEEEYP